MRPQPAEGIEEVPDIGPLHALMDSRHDSCEAQEQQI
jgi:phosphatidylinositol glycan class A protein